jgi:hypothetical protein
LVRIAIIACGKNAKVVQNAARYPMYSMVIKYMECKTSNKYQTSATTRLCYRNFSFKNV